MIEAYKVGITLALTNHVSGALGLIARDFTKTQQHADRLQGALKDIKLLAAAGGAAVGAGFLGMAALKGPLEEAKKFDQQLAKFRLYGLGEQVTNEAATYARAMNVMGSSATENMRLMNEAQGVFRESGLAGSAALEGAKLAAPMLAKINFATESLDEESKARMRTQAMSMMRFVEMRGGLKDAETFNRIADAGWKAIQTSGGNVNWEQMRQFMARGGVAAQGLTDVALFGKLEPIIGELKGSTAGDAIMTSYNRLVGGVKVPNQVAHLLADSGIWDASKIQWNSMGGVKAFKGNPLKDMKTLSTDPVEFYEKNILPMYARMNGGKGLDATERARENTMIFGRNGGKMFSLIDRQLATIHRSVEAQGKALGVEASVKTAGDTLAGKQVDLQAKWNTLMLELGNAILPIAVPALEKLVSALRGLTAWAREHETATKALVVTVGGLSALSAVGGSLLLFTAGIKGLALLLPSLGVLSKALTLATGIPGLITSLGASATAANAPLLATVAALGAVAAAAAGLKMMLDAGLKLTPEQSQNHNGVGWWFGGAVGDWLGKKLKGAGVSVPRSELPDDLRRYLPQQQARSPVLNVPPPPPTQQKTTIEAPVNLDGRQIAKVLADHLYDGMNRAPAGGGAFDSYQSFSPASMPSTP